jgi:hypothetical protein
LTPVSRSEKTSRMMRIETFFDERTSTLMDVLHDEVAKAGVVIDSVTDYDLTSGRPHPDCLHD